MLFLILILVSMASYLVTVPKEMSPNDFNDIVSFLETKKKTYMTMLMKMFLPFYAKIKTRRPLRICGVYYWNVRMISL